MKTAEQAKTNYFEDKLGSIYTETATANPADLPIGPVSEFADFINNTFGQYFELKVRTRSIPKSSISGWTFDVDDDPFNFKTNLEVRDLELVVDREVEVFLLDPVVIEKQTIFKLFYNVSTIYPAGIYISIDIYNFDDVIRSLKNHYNKDVDYSKLPVSENIDIHIVKNVDTLRDWLVIAAKSEAFMRLFKAKVLSHLEYTTVNPDQD